MVLSFISLTKRVPRSELQHVFFFIFFILEGDELKMICSISLFIIKFNFVCNLHVCFCRKYHHYGLIKSFGEDSALNCST